MNIGCLRIADVSVISNQLGIFSEPSCEGYFGKYCENFDGTDKSDVWTNMNDSTVYYNMWIDFIRRRT